MKKIGLTFVFVAVFAMPAHAGMQQALNSMFTSNVTSPGAYSSATRSGFVGGGISLRTPVKPINLVAFDPPRYSSGCGGIDMYGGSFSFINADQFTQLLRNIMNNAIGLLFQAALAAIDPMISNLVDKFQKTVQDLNALASNTCAIANQTINSIKAGSLDNDLRQAATAIGADIGAISDHFTGKNPASTAQDKTQLKAQEDKNPNAGNFTWRALHRTQVADSIGAASMLVDAGDPNSNKTRQFLMSLLGTTVVTSHLTDAQKANLPSSGFSYGNQFTLIELLGRDDLESYTCTGPAIGGDIDAFGPHSCLAVTKEPLGMVNMYDYVRNMLYGDTTKTTATGILNAVKNNSAEAPGAHSIYGKLLNCATPGCNLTTAEKNFLGLAGPIFNLIKDVQFDKTSIPSLSPYIEKRLAIMITMKMGESASKAARTAWNGVDDVAMPDAVTKRIFEIGREMSILSQMKETTDGDLEKAKTIAETIRKNFPALGAN